MGKFKLLVMFGGPSAEYDVSLVSAYNVLNNIDKNIYDIVTIGITKEGKWLLYTGEYDKIKNDNWLEDSCVPAFLSPEKDSKEIIILGKTVKREKIDCIFPVMHGRMVEDGRLQGLLEMSGTPFVGCGTFASVNCMDKIATHIFLSAAGIKNSRWMEFDISAFSGNSIVKEVEENFNYPVFVKPANTGSSIGISKVTDRNMLLSALDTAFEFDKRILVEEFIDGHEVECAVMGNGNPIAAEVGQIIPANDFYDYNAKYHDDKSILKIPADIGEKTKAEVQRLAKKAYKLFCCEGLARVDFFVERTTGEIYLNELNTLPGFTEISMYSKLFAAVGVPYPKLLNKLIGYALEEKKGVKFI